MRDAESPNSCGVSLCVVHRPREYRCHAGDANINDDRPMVVAPNVADVAPAEHKLLAYDREHAITYMRLMDADKAGADWREVARIVLQIDPDQDADRARRAFDTHMTRARWMCRHGYRQLLRDGWP